MKPYQQITIAECQEPLVPIPVEKFMIPPVHPYVELGASYGDKSPYFLRQRVVNALEEAQEILQQQYRQWRLFIFDAYRPVEVQQFMVDYTFNSLCQAQGLSKEELTPEKRQEIIAKVEQFWATPSLDRATPPPHSTGAAIDLTLVNEKGELVAMGGEIDEVSDRSYPHYYAQATTPLEQTYHHHRQILFNVMQQTGFRNHPHEWWHFSQGDQMWAWLSNQEHPTTPIQAYYGRA